MSWLAVFLSELLGSRSPEPVAKRLVLEELQRTLARQFEAADALDSKLKELLRVASLILSLVTTLQLSTGINRTTWFYWVTLALVLVLYAILILVIVGGLRPMVYHSPIPSRWEEIAERFFCLDEDSALSLLISNYLEYSGTNNAPLERKARAVARAFGLLVALILLLVIMGLFGFGGSMSFPWQGPLSYIPTPIPPLPSPLGTPSP